LSRELGRRQESDACLAAQYRLLAARREVRRAISDVARATVVVVHRLLKAGGDWTKPGSNYFDEGVREAAVQARSRESRDTAMRGRWPVVGAMHETANTHAT